VDSRPEHLSGEKRVVTVLSADLVGSIDLSQVLDPEDHAEIVVAFQERGHEIVDDHGGAIASYLGDGILAQFGYPVSHEDDADRALHAAIAIRRMVQGLSRKHNLRQIGLAVRVSVHAGFNVVGRLGAADRNDISLFGDTVNVAAQMQSVADPNEILISQDVAVRLRHEFALADYGVPSLAGVRTRLRVFAVLSQGAGPRRHSPIPLVDRQRELQDLQARLVASRLGTGRAVAIVGLAGVGKSRLVTALADEVGQGNWIEARGSELLAGTAFSVAVQLVERALRIEPNFSPTDRAQCLGRFLETHPLPGVSSTSLLALLSPESLLEPQAAESAFHSAVEVASHVVLSAAADLGHAVIVVEDLQWVDPSSCAVVTKLVEAVPTAPLFVLITARPSPDAGLSLVEPADLLVLDPLPDEAVRRLLAGVSATGSLGKDVSDTIVRRADGIPLFAEALAQLALETGTNPDDLPSTLQASFLARLDRTPQLRGLVQLAAVIGTRVPWDVLSGASGVDLAELLRALDQLVETDILIPDPAGGHRFRHSLIRDAVYASLLRTDRQRAHRQVARTLEKLGISIDHPVEVLALHLAKSGEALGASQQYARAALSAARTGSNEESQGLCERGLAQLGIVGDDPAKAAVELQITMTRGNVINAVEGYGAPGQLELWEHAERLCTATGDTLEQSSAMNGQAVAAMFAGNSGRAIRESKRIIEFGHVQGDRCALLRGHSTFALQSVFMGNVEAALSSAEISIDLYRDGDYFDVTYGFGTDHGVIVRAAAAMASILSGRRQDALTHAGAGVRLAERLDSPISLCLALVSKGTVHLLDGDTGESKATFGEARAVGAIYRLPYYEQIAQLLGAGAAAMEGDPEAESASLRAAEALMTSRVGVGASAGWWAIALAQESSGHREAALATAEAALVAVAETGEHVLDTELHRIASRTGLALGVIDSEAAVRRLVSAANKATTLGMHLLALRAFRDVHTLDPENAVARGHIVHLERSIESHEGAPSKS
jgi:class 3 adenylate cyclase